MPELMEFNVKAKKAPPLFPLLTDAQVIQDMIKAGHVVQMLYPGDDATKEEDWSTASHTQSLFTIAHKLMDGYLYRARDDMKYYFYRVAELKQFDKLFITVKTVGSLQAFDELEAGTYFSKWLTGVVKGVIASDTTII